MNDETAEAYMELAVRSLQLSEEVTTDVLDALQDLMQDLPEKEALERVKRLRYGW